MAACGGIATHCPHPTTHNSWGPHDTEQKPTCSANDQLLVPIVEGHVHSAELRGSCHQGLRSHANGVGAIGYQGIDGLAPAAKEMEVSQSLEDVAGVHSGHQLCCHLHGPHACNWPREGAVGVQVSAGSLT